MQISSRQGSIECGANMSVDLVNEVGATYSLLIAGYLVSRRLTVLSRGGGALVLAYSVAFGVGLVIVVSSFTTLLSMNSRPLALLGPVAVAATVALFRGTGQRASVALRESGLLFVAATTAGALAAAFRWGSLTGDSFHQVANSRLAANNRLWLLAMSDPFDFEEFALGYAMLQMPSAWGGNLTNFSIGPLIGVAILIVLLDALRGGAEGAPAIASWAPVLLVGSSYFYWVMVSYINSHAAVALLLLVAYHASREGGISTIGDVRIVVVILMSLVLLRVENVLLITLFLSTLVWADGRSPQRLMVVRWGFGCIGAVTVIVQAVNYAAYSEAGLPPSRAIVGLGALGLLLMFAGMPLTSRLADRGLLPFRYSVIPLVAANVFYASVDPWAFLESLSATSQNLFMFRGGWGMLAPLLVLLMVGGLIDRGASGDHRELLRFVRNAALLLFFTAFLRDLPFRVGEGDSFNRQLFHLLPLTVLGVGAWVSSWFARGSVISEEVAPSRHPTS